MVNLQTASRCALTIIVDTAWVVHGAGLIKLSSVHPSVCSSIRPIIQPLWQVCCCGPDSLEILVDFCTAGAQQQMQAVLLCELM